MRIFSFSIIFMFAVSFLVPSVHAVTCGPTVCTCAGINDCDALFTSNKCKEGTELTDPDDNGECNKADRLVKPAIKLKQKTTNRQRLNRQRERAIDGPQRIKGRVRSRGIENLPPTVNPDPEPPALPAP